MANASPDGESTSMFVLKPDNSPSPSEPTSRRNSTVKQNLTGETITVKDFFDFMKTAYQVYEHMDGDDEESKIDWEELTKLTVINHVIEPQERDLLHQTAITEQKPITSKSDTTLEIKNSELIRLEKRFSCSEVEGR